jgi:hypothetical protein
MRYKPTLFNITCTFLIGLSIYGWINSGPFGFGFLGMIYIFPIAIIGLIIDFIGQKKLKYLQLFSIELFILLVLTIGFLRTERTKEYIVDENSDLEYIVCIYRVPNAEPLPVNIFTWTYQINVPESGIIMTSSKISQDLPKTKVFTRSGKSVQNQTDSVDVCFGRISKTSIAVDSIYYDYQIWKICEGGAIVSTSKELKLLEKDIQDYIRNKKPSG